MRGLPAQQADAQSALETQPPVMNCVAVPRPTLRAPDGSWQQTSMAVETGEVLVDDGFRRMERLRRYAAA